MENLVENFDRALLAAKIGAKCIDIKTLENYLAFDIRLLPQTTVRKLKNHANELALHLKIPGKPNTILLREKGLVRMEFMLPRNRTLGLFDLFTNDNVPQYKLPLLLGETADGQKVWTDLTKAPHLLIAGTTGSGKSVLLHNIIANLFNYSSCIKYLIDPKRIEFKLYGELKSSEDDLYVKNSYPEALQAIDELLETMEQRYLLMSQGYEDFPYIVLIIDEVADLIAQDHDNRLFSSLLRLAQKCRAARMSIILATQRPSVNIINGSIKANFSARIACKLPSHVDSKVILDEPGAEELYGQGDAILKETSGETRRFQIAYTTDKEVCRMYGKQK